MDVVSKTLKASVRHCSVSPGIERDPNFLGQGRRNVEIVQYAVISAKFLLVRRGPSLSLRIRLVVKLEEVVHFHAISV